MPGFSWNYGRIFLSDLLRKGGFTDRRAKFYKIKFGILLILTINYYKINTQMKQ